MEWMVHSTSSDDRPPSNLQTSKNTLFIDTLLQTPCRKNLEKIIGIILCATSLVHRIIPDFFLHHCTRSYMPFLQQITAFSQPNGQWAYFLSILNDDATISIHNNLHLPMGARIVEFKHTNITSKLQLSLDIPIERHAWSVSETLTQSNANSLMSPSKLCNGSHSIDFVISPLMQLQMLLPQTTQWAHICSVKFGTKTIFRHSFQFPKNFRDTLPHGKPGSALYHLDRFPKVRNSPWNHQRPIGIRQRRI